MATGWLWHEKFAWHDTGTAAGFFKGDFLQPLQHLESPESKARFASLVEVADLARHLRRLDCQPAHDDDLLRVHTRRHVDSMKALSRSGGGDMGDGHSPFGPGGFDIAALAAGGTMSAVRAVVRGEVQNAYALVRPPGHHALPDSGVGFCMFGNVAIAVAYAQAELGVGKVAVVDWDVHHANGTQTCFESDPNVLTISIHQDNNFPPGSGQIGERGVGRGEGSVINIPLPPGSGEGAYLHAFDRVVVPAITRFRPDLILVACGFDSSNADPMGRMLLHSGSYASMTRRLMNLAGEVCGSRLVLSHEGGYSAFYVPFCGLAVLEALSGISTGVVDPYREIFADHAGQDLQEHQRAVIEAAASAHGL